MRAVFWRAKEIPLSMSVQSVQYKIPYSKIVNNTRPPPTN